MAALALTICIFSLMGMPPLAGFWAKLYLFVAVWSLGTTWAAWLVVIAVLNAAIAAAYYLRIVASCYLREPIWEPVVGRSPMVRVGAALCALFVIVVGLLPGGLLAVASRSTAHLRGTPEARIVQPQQMPSVESSTSQTGGHLTIATGASP